MAVNMQIIHPALEMHGEDKTHQPEIMIAMQVADENVIDSMKAGLILHELHLRCLATVDEKKMILYLDELGRRVPSVRRHCAAGTQYGYLKTHFFKNKKTKTV
jgi:hypothetical protein